MILDELRALNPYSFYVAPDVSAIVRGPVRDSNGEMRRAGSGSLTDWLTRTDAERTVAYQRVLAAATPTRPAGDPEAEPAFVRALFFLDAGLRDWAEAELEAVAAAGDNSAATNLRLGRVYEQYAMPWRSVRLYERARTRLSWSERRPLTDDFRFLTYPLPYPVQVLENAARNDIPPHLIYGMIREESRFEADVVSRAGAVGLMQLMPETARRVAAQLDLSTELDGRLDEPAVNVSLGVWYAADLLRDGRGSVAWMLAAYNAGPGAAVRWIDRGDSGALAIEAVESIDYKETRGYVKRVVESANIYHALYFDQAR
jgi:soluble lytic murein transglycosylase